MWEIVNETPTVSELRKSQFSSSYTAMIRLPKTQAQTLLSRRKLSVGWIQCRISERNSPELCYNCQKFGHRARDCKNELGQRPRKCFRCGTEGHIASNCTEEAPIRCYVCGGPHPANSKDCPEFPKLEQALRRTSRTTIDTVPKQKEVCEEQHDASRNKDSSSQS